MEGLGQGWMEKDWMKIKFPGPRIERLEETDWVHVITTGLEKTAVKSGRRVCEYLEEKGNRNLHEQ